MLKLPKQDLGNFKTFHSFQLLQEPFFQQDAQFEGSRWQNLQL